jgi:putative colanic acid biosynthesis acetyltransferase WcaF
LTIFVDKPIEKTQMNGSTRIANQDIAGVKSYSIDLAKSNERWPLPTKIKRVAWNLTWLFLFRPTPKRLGNKFRLFLLNLFGATIQGTPLVDPTCKILLPWELAIGEFSAIGHHVEIYNYGRVSIGPMTVVSQYSYLCTGTHDYTHPHMPLTWLPITIGSECWIAADVFIAPGVVVNDGVVVGARSVVTQTLPPWTVCAGNPCKPIKKRVVKSLT